MTDAIKLLRQFTSDGVYEDAIREVLARLGAAEAERDKLREAVLGALEGHSEAQAIVRYVLEASNEG